MKYTDQQKDSVIRKGLSINILKVKKREKLKKSFPIEVDIKDGYYIIESKINML